MSDRAVSYLKSVIKYCRDILDIQKNYMTYEDFLNNKSYQYSVSFCIEQIGELTKKLRDEGYSDKYPNIPWNEISGLRNRIAHGYDAVDIEMVYDISVCDIPILLDNYLEILAKEDQ